MRRILFATALTAILAWSTPSIVAFCGFYVAKADTKLFNQASQVVLVRDGDRTVMTMANDFEGEPKEFAVVIPVPTFLKREQIHVGEKALVDHLDAYSAPRLVEYFDENPCEIRPMTESLRMSAAAAPRAVTDAMLNWARSRGTAETPITAYLQVNVDNVPALNLYGSLGFVQAYAYHYRVGPADTFAA